MPENPQNDAASCCFYETPLWKSDGKELLKIDLCKNWLQSCFEYALYTTM